MTLEVYVTNDQSERDVATASLHELALATLAAEAIAGSAELSIAFVDPETIAALNEQFLGHEGPTDVLSFAIEDDVRAAVTGARTLAESVAPLLLGDIVICPEIAHQNVAANGGTYTDELELLVVHGILHLLGRDHELDAEAEEMEARERAILAGYHEAAGR